MQSYLNWFDGRADSEELYVHWFGGNTQESLAVSGGYTGQHQGYFGNLAAGDGNAMIHDLSVGWTIK